MPRDVDSDARVPDAAEYRGPTERTLEFEDVSGGEQIGSGGFADASLATVDGTQFVVKEPNSGAKTVESVEAFIEEAETWAKVDNHDHVVGVVDWGTRLPWIVLEYMDGGNLRDRIDAGGLETAEALWIGICLSRAVHHAHRHGVVHLDLTPNNVLFRETEADLWDVPKIGDWGLSKTLLEHSGTVDGLTPNYAAPEQFDPDEYGDPDDYTDRFQLAAVVYEALTGEQAFQGSTATVMRQVLAGEVKPPTTVDPTLPEQADDIFDRALATEKTDRYETVVNFRRDLVDVFETVGKGADTKANIAQQMRDSIGTMGEGTDTEGDRHDTTDESESNGREQVQDASFDTDRSQKRGGRPEGLYETAADLGVERTFIEGIFSKSEQADSRRAESPVRFAVERSYTVDGDTHIMGQVIAGTLSDTDRLEFSPSETVVDIDAIEAVGSGDPMATAEPGTNVNVVVTENDCSGEISLGHVGASVTDTPTEAETFEGLMYVVDHPSVVTAGYTPVVHATNSQVACTIEALNLKMEMTGTETWETDHEPDFAESGEAVQATFKPQKPLALDTFDSVPENGWFTVRDAGEVVAIGIVTDIAGASSSGSSSIAETEPFTERLPSRPPGTDEEFDYIDQLTAGMTIGTVPSVEDAPLRLPVDDVYELPEIGAVATGTVLTGALSLNDEVQFQPSDASGTVDTIEQNQEDVSRASPGETVGFHVDGVAKDDIRRGDVCAPTADPSGSPETFRARLFVSEHPSVITAGYTPVVHAHTAQVACTFESLEAKIDPDNGQVIERNPDFVQSGDVAEVVLDPQKPISVEPVEEIPELGVFSVRDMGQTIGVGMVWGTEQ
jgi:translation elongation factor EF-1alpha